MSLIEIFMLYTICDLIVIIRVEMVERVSCHRLNRGLVIYENSKIEIEIVSSL